MTSQAVVCCVGGGTFETPLVGEENQTGRERFPSFGAEDWECGATEWRSMVVVVVVVMVVGGGGCSGRKVGDE